MSGKLKIPSDTRTPDDPMVVKAYCEGRKFKKGGGTITYATGTTGAVGTNNGLTYTAKIAGNGQRVKLRNPMANSAGLFVDVDGGNITVTLATNGSGVITSTATQVAAAIAAKSTANALVSVANTGASTGAGACDEGVATLAGSNYTANPGYSANAWAFTRGVASWGGGTAGARDCCADLPTA